MGRRREQGGSKPGKRRLWLREIQRTTSCFPLNQKTNDNSKESGDVSGVRAGPRVRQVRQEMEGVPNNSRIKRNDFHAILKKSKSMQKLSVMNKIS